MAEWRVTKLLFICQSGFSLLFNTWMCACWQKNHAGCLLYKLESLSPSIYIKLIYYWHHHYQVRLLVSFNNTPQVHQMSLSSTTRWLVSITFCHSNIWRNPVRTKHRPLVRRCWNFPKTPEISVQWSFSTIWIHTPIHTYTHCL